jgi:hypothetical protein
LKFDVNSTGTFIERRWSWITQSWFGHVHNWEWIGLDKFVELIDDEESDSVELGGE